MMLSSLIFYIFTITLPTDIVKHNGFSKNGRVTICTLKTYDFRYIIIVQTGGAEKLQTGQKIASLREKAGLTQEQFAQKLFVSRELVSKWETGRRHPAQKTVKEIAAVLGTDENEIAEPVFGAVGELSACIPDGADFSAAELTSALNDFLGTLSQTERNVFISRYYHGMSSSETASALGLGESNVRKKLMLLRGKFRDCLKEKQNG